MINQVLPPKGQVLFTHNSAYIFLPAYQTYEHTTLDGWVAVKRVRYERHYRRTAATPRGGQRTPPKAGGGIVPRRGVKKYPEGAARSPPPKGHTGRREPSRRLGGRAQAGEAKRSQPNGRALSLGEPHRRRDVQAKSLLSAGISRQQRWSRNPTGAGTLKGLRRLLGGARPGEAQRARRRAGRAGTPQKPEAHRAYLNEKENEPGIRLKLNKLIIKNLIIVGWLCRLPPFNLKARGRGAHPPPNTTRRPNKAEQPDEEKQGKRGEPRGGGKGAARPGPQDHRRKATAAEKGAAQSGRRKGRPRRGRGEEDERPEGGRKTTRGRGAGPNGPGGAPRTRRRPPRERSDRVGPRAAAATPPHGTA